MKPIRSAFFLTRIAGIVLLLVVFCCVGGWLLNRPKRPSVTDLLAQARSALRTGKVEESESAVRAALTIAPEDSSAWMLLATIAERQRRFPAAIAAYEHVTEPKHLAKAGLAAGHLCLREPGMLAAAERHFRSVFNLDSANMEACEGLAQVLAVSGRSRELVTLLIAMIRGQSFGNFHLYLLSCGGESTIDPQLIGDADDARTRAARGCLFLKRGDFAAARAELRRSLDAEPDREWTQLALGRALLESDSPVEAVVEWRRSLSPTIEVHPEYWQLAGDWSRQRGDLVAAARCDWETVRRDPNSLAACFQLGRYLRESGDESHAASFLNRAEELQQYKTIVETARNGSDLTALQQTVDLAERLGLIWEAYGWSDLAARRDATIEWPRSVRDRLAARLAALPEERTVHEQNPALKIDLSALPLPQFNGDSADGSPPGFASDEHRSDIRFLEEATSVGLTFQYINGGDPISSGLQRMFEFTGGGVAVLDFDRDEWPDAYFVQGCRWDER
ncbi:MAG: tetratricopeptide repeat protein, partial [Planctomycetaceae bacterium]|nr:tetratricopeptide repeat protein [Planctomycetaceae bacterium]